MNPIDFASIIVKNQYMLMTDKYFCYRLYNGDDEWIFTNKYYNATL